MSETKKPEFVQQVQQRTRLDKGAQKNEKTKQTGTGQRNRGKENSCKQSGPRK